MDKKDELCKYRFEQAKETIGVAKLWYLTEVQKGKYIYSYKYTPNKLIYHRLLEKLQKQKRWRNNK